VNGGVRAPPTLGTFLRTFTFGHVRPLNAVASRLLISLCRRAPLLPGADTLAYVDVDDTVKPTFGYDKQGAGRGYTGVKGLNVLLAIISSPTSRPVIAAARLRKGATKSAKGAHRLVADSLVTARSCGATGTLVLRADSAFFQSDVIAAVLRAKACFSITARLNQPSARRSKPSPRTRGHRSSTPTPSGTRPRRPGSARPRSPRSPRSPPSRPWPRPSRSVPRLIVRRVPDVNPKNKNPLFTVYRHHAVFTNSPLPMLENESAHRGHAIVEQVIADLKSGPLAHLPSGSCPANSAWLVCASMAFNLTRTAGVLASTFHAKATTCTIRAQTDQRARPARPLRPTARAASARRLALGDRLEAARRNRPRRATTRGLTPSTPSVQDQPEHHVETTGPPGRTSTPSTPRQLHRRLGNLSDHPTVDPGLVQPKGRPSGLHPTPRDRRPHDVVTLFDPVGQPVIEALTWVHRRVD